MLTLVLKVVSQTANGNLIPRQLAGELILYRISCLFSLKIYAINALDPAARLIFGLNFVPKPSLVALALGDIFFTSGLLGVRQILPVDEVNRQII